MNILALAALLGGVAFLAAAETAAGAPAINARVRAALQADLGTAARHIQVDSFGGTVQLSGPVDSKSTSDRALRIATDVDGVNHVENALVQN